MKDYKKIAEKIRKMGTFSNIYNCGCPTEIHPVNLCFELSEAYIIGYRFYVAYSFGSWSIDYTIDRPVNTRAEMRSINGIKTDREMYKKVEGIIDKIRERCDVKKSIKE